MGLRAFGCFGFGGSDLKGNNGDVFCLGKSQQGVTSSCSRLT